MNLKQLFFTENACYKAGTKIAVKGIMVHSTGANNPALKRYAGPDDGLLGKNQYGNHWNQNTPDGRQVCVHAFIGKLDDGTVATYQTLPWDRRGWHCGSGSKGSGNDTHISFEICEDGLTDAAYFGKVYREAVELCAYLCKQYGLDPKGDGVLICHSEGHARGIASNHGDVMHWFPKHGKTMSTFRDAVAAEMNANSGSGGSTEGYTAIMGNSIATAAQMRAYFLAKNAAATSYANTLPQIYVEEAAAEGVRADIAFAQSCLETGNFKFGGDVKPEQNNYCGLGATGGGVAGNAFATPRDGVRAQIQHLKAYACTADLKNACVDPRFKYVERGSAEFVEWLGIKENPNGKGWASAAGYGKNVLSILAALISTAAPEPSTLDNTPADWEAAAVNKAIAKKILLGDDKGNYQLHSGVTKAQVLVMMDRAGILD